MKTRIIFFALLGLCILAAILGCPKPVKNYDQPGTIVVEAFCGTWGGEPLEYLSLDHDGACLAVAAKHLGVFYGYFGYNNGPTQDQILQDMCGSTTREPVWGEFLTYVRNEYSFEDWNTFAYNSSNEVVDNLYWNLAYDDIVVVNGGAGSIATHTTTVFAIRIDSAAYNHPVQPSVVVGSVLVAEPYNEGTLKGGVVDLTANSFKAWLKPNYVNNALKYVTLHRVFTGSPKIGGEVIADASHVTFGESPVLRLGKQRPDLPVIPPAYEGLPIPSSLRDTVESIAGVLLERQGIIRHVTQNRPEVLAVLANSFSLPPFQLDKVNRDGQEIPNNDWIAQLATVVNGDTVVIAESMIEYYQGIGKGKYSAWFVEAGELENLSKRTNFNAADAFMRESDVVDFYGAAHAVPFNDDNDIWPSEVKWYVYGGKLTEPIVVNRGGVQMGWDPLTKDYLRIEQGADSDVRTLPTTFTLQQNYPNPFNPTTTIQFTLPQASDWTLDITNVLGQKVTTFNGHGIGQQQCVWDAGDNASGMYLYTLRADAITETKKMVLLK